MTARILILDIETAPSLAFIWRMYKENIGAKQVVATSEMLSYAAKWLGSPEIIYDDARDDPDDNRLVAGLCLLLQNADMVVAHNGRSFDLKQIRGRALLNGEAPFAPVKIIDTKEIAKKEFGFMSNSLEFLAKAFGVKEKKNHAKFPGFLLWSECLKGNREAWDEMKEYNIGDIVTLEEVYLKMRGWATDHPNVGVYIPEEKVKEVCCPKCGSPDLIKRGFYKTNVTSFQRFCCSECGGWSRSRTAIDKLPAHVTYNAR